MDASTGTTILTLSPCHTIKLHLPVRHSHSAPHMCRHQVSVGFGLLIGLRVCTVALFDEKSQCGEIVFRTRKSLLTADECQAVLQEVCLCNATLFFPRMRRFPTPEFLVS